MSGTAAKIKIYLPDLPVMSFSRTHLTPNPPLSNNDNKLSKYYYMKTQRPIDVQSSLLLGVMYFIFSGRMIPHVSGHSRKVVDDEPGGEVSTWGSSNRRTSSGRTGVRIFGLRWSTGNIES